MEAIHLLLEEHWDKILYLITGAVSVVLWLRVGRFKDRRIANEHQIDSEMVLHNQLDRMNVKITQLYSKLLEKENTIALLAEHCPECVLPILNEQK